MGHILCLYSVYVLFIDIGQTGSVLPLISFVCTGKYTHCSTLYCNCALTVLLEISIHNSLCCTVELSFHA